MFVFQYEPLSARAYHTKCFGDTSRVALMLGATDLPRGVLTPLHGPCLPSGALRRCLPNFSFNSTLISTHLQTQTLTRSALASISLYFLLSQNRVKQDTTSLSVCLSGSHVFRSNDPLSIRGRTERKLLNTPN